jgi:hypothetical protein
VASLSAAEGVPPRRDWDWAKADAVLPRTSCCLSCCLHVAIAGHAAKQQLCCWQLPQYEEGGAGGAGDLLLRTCAMPVVETIAPERQPC